MRNALRMPTFIRGIDGWEMPTIIRALNGNAHGYWGY